MTLTLEPLRESAPLSHGRLLIGIDASLWPVERLGRSLQGVEPSACDNVLLLDFGATGVPASGSPPAESTFTAGSLGGFLLAACFESGLKFAVGGLAGSGMSVIAYTLLCGATFATHGLPERRAPRTSLNPGALAGFGQSSGCSARPNDPYKAIFTSVISQLAASYTITAFARRVTSALATRVAPATDALANDEAMRRAGEAAEAEEQRKLRLGIDAEYEADRAAWDFVPHE